METFDIQTIDLILMAVAGALLLVQLVCYLALYGRIIFRNKKAGKGNIKFTDEHPPLSVVISTRDDATKLKEFLPSILEQDYPLYEVIVINDNSVDDTGEVLSALEEKYPHLYHSFIPDSSRYISRKKLALTLGIKASKYDWVVFTEPGCYPAGKNWLRTMARNFTDDTDVVLGYCGYERAIGWLNKRVSYDFLFTGMRYLCFALARMPYMGIGKNMAYRKEVFFRNKGFSTHLNLQPGDDDLFINRVATRKNTRVETAAEAVVRMKPVSHKDWKEEKISYMVTSGFLRGGQRFALGLETCTRLLFYAAVVAVIVSGLVQGKQILLGIAVLLWVFRYALQAVIINKTASTLGEKRRYYFALPVFDFLQPLQSLSFKFFRMVRRRDDYMRK